MVGSACRIALLAVGFASFSLVATHAARAQQVQIEIGNTHRAGLRRPVAQAQPLKKEGRADARPSEMPAAQPQQYSGGGGISPGTSIVPVTQ